jgi:hypothetical protein
MTISTTILYHEWRKVRDGSCIFGVLLAATAGYAQLAQSFYQVAVITVTLLSLYTVHLVRAFTAEQRQNQLPFQLGLPVSPLKTFLFKYLPGVALLLAGGTAGLLVVSCCEPVRNYFPLTGNWFYLSLLWAALYAFLLMNSQWSEHGIAESILQITIFAGILTVNVLTEFFYAICFGDAARFCATLQLLLILSVPAGMIWTGGIYRNRLRRRLTALAYLVLFLLPPLQFGLGIGINILHLSRLEKQMAEKGIELVELPFGETYTGNPNMTVDTPEKAEHWLNYSDLAPVHRRTAQVLDRTAHHHGQLIDLIMPYRESGYLRETLKAYYLTGNETEFLRTFNYLHSIHFLYNLQPEACLNIFALPDSPLETPAFYRRWLELAARADASILYNRSANNLRAILRQSDDGSLFNRVHAWSRRAWGIKEFLKGGKPLPGASALPAKLIGLKLHYLEHGSLPETLNGPFEYRRLDQNTFTLKTNQTTKISFSAKPKETGK